METGRQVRNPRQAPSSRTERAYCVSEGVERDSLRQRLSMDVRCKLLGHVRDSTEFEERHEDRPRGTVLICREFQVCRRCGDRKEMYRNEQGLVAGPGRGRPGGRREAGRPRESRERRRREPGERPDRGRPARDPGRRARCRGQRPAGGHRDGVRWRSQHRRAPAGEHARRTGGRRGVADGDGEGPAEPDDAGQVTDNGVVLSDASAGSGSSDDTRNSQAVADGRGRTPADRHGDDSPTSFFDAGHEETGEIHCDNCGREWEEDGTALREGDICPQCRGAYFEER